MTTSTASGNTLTTLTGAEDISTVTLEHVKGVSCAPEDRDAVRSLLATAANKLIGVDIFRGVAVRVAGSDTYTAYVAYKTDVAAADRKAADKKLYG